MTRAALVFLFDVDNTLIDNDRIVADMKTHLVRQVGEEIAGRYWDIFERTRAELTYVDYLGALQEARRQMPRELQFLEMSRYLIDYPFAQRLYPNSLDAVEHVRRWGRPAILSDGDVVFQPRKIDRSGLWEAFAGHVMVYVHKEAESEDVARRYPADHYVLVDDKLRLLTAYKRLWGERITTVWPRQGHYARDPKTLQENPAPDVTIERIGDLLTLERDRLVPKV